MPYGYQYQVLLAGLQVSDREYSDATATLQNILTNFTAELDTATTESINNLITMVDVYEELDDEDWNWNNISSGTKTIIEDMAEDDILFGGDGARALMAMFEGEDYPMYLLEASEFASKNSMGVNMQVAARKAAITLYPNPTEDLLNILVPPNLKTDRLLITDMMGKTVGQQNIRLGNNEVATRHLSPGVYFIKFTEGTKLVDVQKFIKQ